MKKLIFICGIIATNLVMSGSIFKVMHWPGANILLTVGILLFALLFLPMALYNHYTGSSEDKKTPLLHIVTGIVFVTGALGMLFKIMHWPGASILMAAGILLPFVLFLPVFVYSSRDKNKFSRTQINAVLFGLTFIAVFSVMLVMRPSQKYMEQHPEIENAINK